MPATAPKATQVTDAIVARLQAITVDAGYYTNLGLNVHRLRWTALRADEVPLPVLTILPQTDERAGGAAGDRMHTRTYLLEAILSAQEASDDEQDAILHDIRRALTVHAAPALGTAANPLAASLTLDTAILDDPEIGSDLAIVRVPLTVTYAETYTR